MQFHIWGTGLHFISKSFLIPHRHLELLFSHDRKYLSLCRSFFFKKCLPLNPAEDHYFVFIAINFLDLMSLQLLRSQEILAFQVRNILLGNWFDVLLRQYVPMFHKKAKQQIEYQQYPPLVVWDHSTGDTEYGMLWSSKDAYKSVMNAQ